HGTRLDLAVCRRADVRRKRSMIAVRLALALGVLAAGCGPAVIWSGHTADRRHQVEVVERSGLRYVIVDGQRRAASHGGAGWSIALAGEHIAFAARVDDRWTVVTDGRAGQRWDQIGGIELTAAGTPVYAAARDGAWYVVVG